MRWLPGTLQGGLWGARCGLSAVTSREASSLGSTPAAAGSPIPLKSEEQALGAQPDSPTAQMALKKYSCQMLGGRGQHELQAMLQKRVFSYLGVSLSQTRSWIADVAHSAQKPAPSQPDRWEAASPTLARSPAGSPGVFPAATGPCGNGRLPPAGFLPSAVLLVTGEARGQ
ncbi:PREDICTED: uncharacterized protein LOC105520488 [Colobus angolensis palliatus]|uniref:uncharacterized protein LOC105520488 n=1 Tax=Colobus angolensis palliatus TaxID=336983 RepID=UPI0005F3B6D3|nr:PREDICTED: uncharacterized protein LOC105520488 [Colobus angolensis palliatus]